MKTFRLVILTPRGVYLDANVEELYLLTSKGYMGIFANHDTLITSVSIAPGFIKINNKREYYAIFLGVLNIAKDKVSLIVNNIEHAESIDLKRAQAAQARAIERINKRDDKTDYARAELALKRAVARIGTINRNFI